MISWFTSPEFAALGIFGSKFTSLNIENGEWIITDMPRLLLVIALCAIGSYILGSLNFAIIISKLYFHDDIRNYGSKNAGMTNMMRTYGRAPAILTFLGDLFKGIIAVTATQILVGRSFAHIAMLFCILGHCFPVWYNFKGGKGIATAAACILCLEPFVFVILLLTFIIVVAFTKYISLGSIMALLMYPLTLNAFLPHTGISIPGIVMPCALVTALLIIYLHRSNMKRLLNHTENKFSFKKKGTQNSDSTEDSK